jgi:hypothetical protein
MTPATKHTAFDTNVDKIFLDNGYDTDVGSTVDVS